MSAPFVQIALNRPLRDAYDYALPAEFGPRVRLGARVRVPFGRQELVGYCVGFLEAPTIEPERIKPILGVVDDEPLMDEHMLELTRWVADHYGCAWGEVLEAALPAGVRRNVTSRAIQVVEAVLEGAELRAKIAEFREKKPLRKRAALLEALDSTGDELTPFALAELAHCAISTVHSARDAGLVRYRTKVVTEHPVDDIEPETPPRFDLTAGQEVALRVVRDKLGAGQFAVVLLHGVTGSGKTEVYLRAIADAVAAGSQAIVLVPEISLTPQTIRRFKGRFDRVAVLHSHLTASQRHEQWRTIRRGEADVVIGPRSAVFAPVRKLGIVVVDEEHETAFKQESVPRYHARDVAVVRARMAGAVVVLGSATPSLESSHNARRGRYAYVALAHRVRGLPMPPVEIVDMTAEMHEMKRAVFISRRLENLMRESLDADGQVILFLNRRAYSTLLYCPRCQHTLRCPKCDVPFVYHRQRGIVLCHYCGEQMPPPGICPECVGAKLRRLGAGTERIEDDIAGKFGSYGVARMDSDTTRGRAAHRKLLDRFRSGEARILVGTQMIAKGLDFPQVTLVGVVSADTSLWLPDFRAAERTFQLVEQVAGRAGRGLRGGRVLVQTTNPDHAAIQAAARHDYAAFAKAELDQRLELGYPPFGHLIRIVVTASTGEIARRRAEQVAAHLAGLPVAAGIQVLGPAECPLATLRGKSRWHLLIKAPDRAKQRAATRALRQFTGGSAKALVALDVDPVSMM